MESSRPVIAIGPEADRPTWSWVGFSLMRELSHYFNVVAYNGEDIPPCSAVIAIKEPPSEAVLRDLKQPVIYAPCDYFESEEQIRTSPIIRHSAAILAHSPALVQHLAQKHPRVLHIEHDDKYSLAVPNNYRTTGPIIWIGFSRYCQLLIDWIDLHPLAADLLVLTDRPDLVPKRERLSTEWWSPRRQQQLLAVARAALDIKGSSFNQRMRPPEKTQTYILSGIPAAINSDSPLVEYFRTYGLNIASPADPDYWFSRDYWEATRQAMPAIRSAMSLKRTGERVRDLIGALI